MQFGTKVIGERITKLNNWIHKKIKEIKDYQAKEAERNKKEIGLLKQRVEIKKLKVQLDSVGKSKQNSNTKTPMEETFGGDNYSISKPHDEYIKPTEYIR